MQALSSWRPPSGTLGRIVNEAQERAQELRANPALELALRRRAAGMSPAPSLRAALRTNRVEVIAEIKRRSPSKGVINAGISASDQARAYVSGGAAALSVLTEPRHFGGSVEDLNDARKEVHVPLLKKDFHVDWIQLVEARAIGASAALLIARALSPTDLDRMVATARELDLEVVVEIRDEAELERALAVGAQLIGINNRDLETLTLDVRVMQRLIPLVPPDLVAIAESGIVSADVVRTAAECGADAVLVGSHISAAADAAGAVRALIGVEKRARGA